jgi:hypothetical protein
MSFIEMWLLWTLMMYSYLTIMHPIADFIVQPIWFERNPKRAKLIHYIVAGPMHVLWDGQGDTFLRRHRKYEIGSKLYFMWTGVDQLAHAVLNLVFSGVVGLFCSYWTQVMYYG